MATSPPPVAPSVDELFEVGTDVDADIRTDVGVGMMEQLDEATALSAAIVEAEERLATARDLAAGGKVRRGPFPVGAAALCELMLEDLEPLVDDLSSGLARETGARGEEFQKARELCLAGRVLMAEMCELAQLNNERWVVCHKRGKLLHGLHERLFIIDGDRVGHWALGKEETAEKGNFMLHEVAGVTGSHVSARDLKAGEGEEETVTIELVSSKKIQLIIPAEHFERMTAFVEALTPTAEFWALKLGSGHVKNWQRRYFRLYPTVLSYFHDDTKRSKHLGFVLTRDIDPKTVITNVEDGSLIEHPDVQSAKKTNKFAIGSADRTVSQEATALALVATWTDSDVCDFRELFLLFEDQLDMEFFVEILRELVTGVERRAEEAFELELQVESLAQAEADLEAERDQAALLASRPSAAAAATPAQAEAEASKGPSKEANKEGITLTTADEDWLAYKTSSSEATGTRVHSRGRFKFASLELSQAEVDEIAAAMQSEGGEGGSAALAEHRRLTDEAGEHEIVEGKASPLAAQTLRANFAQTFGATATASNHRHYKSAGRKKVAGEAAVVGCKCGIVPCCCAL